MHSQSTLCGMVRHFRCSVWASSMINDFRCQPANQSIINWRMVLFSLSTPSGNCSHRWQFCVRIQSAMPNRSISGTITLHYSLPISPHPRLLLVCRQALPPHRSGQHQHEAIGHHWGTSIISHVLAVVVRLIHSLPNCVSFGTCKFTCVALQAQTLLHQEQSRACSICTVAHLAGTVIELSFADGLFARARTELPRID